MKLQKFYNLIQDNSIIQLIEQKKIINIDLTFDYENVNYYNCLCFFNSNIANFGQKELLKFFTQDELQYYNKNNLNNSLDNKICAKYAIGNLSNESNDDNNLNKINIIKGIFGQPIAIYKKYPQFDISISDKIIDFNNISCAIAFDKKFPLSIDLESLDNNNANQIASQLTNSEINQFVNCKADLISLWSAKEAASKMTQSGFYSDFKIYEICNMVKEQNYIIYYFKYFSHYKAICYLFKDFLFTIITPNKAKIIKLI